MSQEKNSDTTTKKSFDFFIGCAQIISTIVGVISLILSFIALLWAVKNPNAVPQIIQIVLDEPTTDSAQTHPAQTPIPTTIVVSLPTIKPTEISQPYSTILDNVTYTLVEVAVNGSETIFWFTGTNKGADKDTCLWFASNLVDNGGVTHTISNRIVGDKRGGLDCYTLKLPYNVPVRFGLVFSSLPPTTTEIPFLEVQFGGRAKFQVRDIPVPYVASSIQ